MNKNITPYTKDAGFSLIELIVVMVILAIALAIAAPNFRGWAENYRLQGAARALYSNMQRAKSEAIKRNCRIGISFSPTSSTDDGSYTVFIDDGSGTGGVADDLVQNGSEPILAQVTMPKGCTLDKDEITFGDSKTGYNSRGLPLESRIGSVVLSNDNGIQYKIKLSISGYARVLKSRDNGLHWE